MYFREGYTHFPYRSGEGSEDCQNPTPNIGGIDLQNHPEQIDLIPEIALLPELKQTLVELNKPTSPLITLACSHWINKYDNSHFSYLEFSFKDRSVTNTLQKIQSFENKFHLFLVEKLTEQFTEEQRDYYVAYLKDQAQVYYRHFYYLDDEEPHTLLGLTFLFEDQETVDLHHKALHIFLMQYSTQTS